MTVMLYRSFSGDPLDNRYIELRTSEKYPEAGEGAFAKVGIPPEVFFVVYGGFIYTSAEHIQLDSTRTAKLLEEGFKDTDPEVQVYFKNRFTSQATNTIEIAVYS